MKTEEILLCKCGKPRKRSDKYIQENNSCYYKTCGDPSCRRGYKKIVHKNTTIKKAVKRFKGGLSTISQRVCSENCYLCGEKKEKNKSVCSKCSQPATAVARSNFKWVTKKMMINGRIKDESKKKYKTKKKKDATNFFKRLRQKAQKQLEEDSAKLMLDTR